MSLNKVTLIGRLGKDPEIKTTRSGAPFANFSLATSKRWKDREGQRQERTEWHRCVCWNENLVGIIEQYVRKGSQIYIEGELQTREWEKDGDKRYSTEVVLQGFDCKVVLLDSKNDRGGGRDDDRGSRSSGGGNGSQSGGGRRNNDLDDDIPF